MKKLGVFATALLAASSAFAEFEGLLHMKISSAHGDGTMKVFLSKRGVRSEMDMKNPQMPMKFATLILFDKPDTAYQVNDAAKTYAELDLKKARAMAEKHGDKAYTVKDLGEETVQGYRCRHVLVSGARSGETELWTSRDILDYDTFARTHGQAHENAAFQKALKNAEADGFPVKSVHRAKEETVIMELVKAEKRALPPAIFEIPKDYTKTKGFAPLDASSGQGMPPEAMKAMQEQMKNMTPEQREMMEKALRGRGQQ